MFAIMSSESVAEDLRALVMSSVTSRWKDRSVRITDLRLVVCDQSEQPYMMIGSIASKYRFFNLAALKSQMERKWRFRAKYALLADRIDERMCEIQLSLVSRVNPR